MISECNLMLQSICSVKRILSCATHRHMRYIRNIVIFDSRSKLKREKDKPKQLSRFVSNCQWLRSMEKTASQSYKICKSDWCMLLILTESKSIHQSDSRILHGCKATFSTKRNHWQLHSAARMLDLSIYVVGRDVMCTS